MHRYVTFGPVVICNDYIGPMEEVEIKKARCSNQKCTKAKINVKHDIKFCQDCGSPIKIKTKKEKFLPSWCVGYESENLQDQSGLVEGMEPSDLFLVPTIKKYNLGSWSNDSDNQMIKLSEMDLNQILKEFQDVVQEEIDELKNNFSSVEVVFCVYSVYC